MVNGQGFTVLGHTGGDVLRYRRGAIDRAVENCKLLVGDSNCVRWGFTDWDLGGMSGGPLLDHDGAVRGIHIASNLWLPDDEKLAFRMDAAARWSNDIRQIVRDQSPRVLGLLPGHSLARLRVRAREWEAETQAWGRVCATPVPASALDADGLPIDPTDHERWPSGWSIFSVDAEFQHVLHLRTSDDGGEVIPDVVHEDVTVLNGLCRTGAAGHHPRVVLDRPGRSVGAARAARGGRDGGRGAVDAVARRAQRARALVETSHRHARRPAVAERRDDVVRDGESHGLPGRHSPARRRECAGAMDLRRGGSPGDRVLDDEGRPVAAGARLRSCDNSPCTASRR
jgi:hypothetical protein